jgi:hypothetical protein
MAVASVCPSPVKVRRVGLVLTDLADEYGLPVVHRLGRVGIGLGKAGVDCQLLWFSCTSPRQTLSWAQESPGAGLDRALPYPDASGDRAETN